MPTSWQKFDLQQSWDFPKVSGCYVIYIDNIPSYIGSAVNVRHRLQTHCQFLHAYIQTPWGQFRDVKVKLRKARKYGEWTMAELRLIRRIKPRFNRRGV